MIVSCPSCRTGFHLRALATSVGTARCSRCDAVFPLRAARHTYRITTAATARLVPSLAHADARAAVAVPVAPVVLSRPPASVPIAGVAVRLEAAEPAAAAVLADLAARVAPPRGPAPAVVWHDLEVRAPQPGDLDLGPMPSPGSEVRARVSPLVPVAAALAVGLLAGLFLAPWVGAASWIASAAGGGAGAVAGGGWSLWRSSRS